MGVLMASVWKYGKTILACLPGLLLPLTALADTAQTHVYKVAVDSEYAPYEFRDVDGKVKGMLPDMLRAIGKSAGVTFQFIPMAWPDAVNSLKTGQVDLLNMIRTPARIGKYEFSNPHSIITQALFRNSNETEIHDVQTLAGHVVALQKYDIAVEKLVGQTNFKRLIVNSKDQGFLAVDSGKAAAFFSASQPGLYFMQEHHLEHVELAAVNLWPQDFCFTAKKGNTAIIAMLNDGLAKLRLSGEYTNIITKWRIQPKSWLGKHITQIIAVVVILFVMALALWLWVFLLRRTVQQRTYALSEEHQRLQQSENRYRGLLESMPNALLVIDDEMITYANPTAQKLLGLNASASLQGVSVSKLMPEACAGLIREQIRQILDTAHVLYAVEGTLLRLDGTEFDAEVTSAPCEYQGSPAVQLIIHDISDRKRAEAELQRLFSIIETSSDFISMADVDGHVLYVNPVGRKMMAIAEDVDISSMEIKDFHSPEEMERMRGEILPAVIKHGGYQTELVFLTRKGEEILTLASFSAQKKTDGSVMSFAVIARDIRQKRKEQQHMEHVQRLESLGVLAGGIAHDFNNILTAILGNAALAESKVASHPEDMPKHLHNIVTSSEKAAALCKQMLAYSGKGRFVVKPLNVSTLTEDITKLLEVSITRNVVLKYQLAEQLPAVDADEAQIQQVIMNLVINASDAIGDKSGVIAINTGVMHADRAYLSGTCLDEDMPEGRYVFLEVSDTGCGMDEETRKRIFDPFFTTKFTGRGLGMSAVLGIIRGHRGALKLYSELGRGTTFKMLLPVSDQRVENADATADNGEVWQGCGTVLIVDDEETICETAAMMLEGMGFSTLTARDGEEGVEVYRQHQQEITAVLLDMTMPKLDGKGTFRELKRINKDVRVILSSGYNEQDATSHFSGKGLAGFIQKPYHLDALQEIIRTVTAG